MWYVQVHSGEFKLLYISFAPAKFLTWGIWLAVQLGTGNFQNLKSKTNSENVSTNPWNHRENPRLPHLEGYWPRSDRWIPHHQSSTPQNDLAFLLMFFWLVVEPTPLKNIGNLTQMRVKRKKYLKPPTSLLFSRNRFFGMVTSMFLFDEIDHKSLSKAKAKEYTTNNNPTWSIWQLNLDPKRHNIGLTSNS